MFSDLSPGGRFLKNPIVRSNRIRNISFHFTKAFGNSSSNRNQLEIKYSLFYWESVAVELYFQSSSV